MDVSNSPHRLPAVHEAWLPREHPLHRPRHGGRQLTALICALTFFVVPSLPWLVGARPSEIENHKLTGFPSIADGWAFFTDLPAWATDQLIFRAGAIQAADAVSRTVFGEPAPLDHGGGDATGPLPVPAQPPSTPGTPGQSGTPDTQDGYRRVVEGSDGWLYYGLDMRLKCSPGRPFEETFAKLDELRDAVESSGRRFVLAIAPDKSTMVPQHLPDSYAGKSCSRSASEEFWALADQREYVLDLRAPLANEARRLDRPVYYRTDTHWTDDGAVVLTRELAEAVRPGVTRTWTQAFAGWTAGVGDLSQMLGRSDKKLTMRYGLRPDGITDRTSEAASTLSTPVHRTSAPLDSTVNDPTLVFGDSFTLSATQYLPAGFSDVTILGYPSLAKDERTALRAFADADVVVVQAVERSVAGSVLPFLDDGFIERARQALAARPVR